MDRSTDITLTLIAMAVCAAITLFSLRRQFVEKTAIRPYRVPWMFIALVAIATAVMLLVHLVNLFGFETGRR